MRLPDNSFNGNPKYGFTGREKAFRGRQAREIVALRDFGGVKKGELGGWIASEHNLSHTGNCWLRPDCYAVDESQIGGNAIVSGSAIRLWGKSQINGNAIVSGSNIWLLYESQISGNAIVSGSDIDLHDDSQISGNAIASGSDIWLFSNSQISGNAIASGSGIRLGYDSQISGNAIVSGSGLNLSGTDLLTTEALPDMHDLIRPAGLIENKYDCGVAP